MEQQQKLMDAPRGRISRGITQDPSCWGSFGRCGAVPTGLATVVAWGLATWARLSLSGLGGALRATCIWTVYSLSTGTMRWAMLSCRGTTREFGVGLSDLAPVSVGGLAKDTWVVCSGRAIAPSTSSGWSTCMGERRRPSDCSGVPPCSSSIRCRCSGVSGTSSCNKTFQMEKASKRIWTPGDSVLGHGSFTVSSQKTLKETRANYTGIQHKKNHQVWNSPGIFRTNWLSLDAMQRLTSQRIPPSGNNHQICVLPSSSRCWHPDVDILMDPLDKLYTTNPASRDRVREPRQMLF